MQRPEPIAPVAVFEYAPDGRVLATVPHGGISVLDQFALAAMQPLIEEDKLTNEGIAVHAYNIAEAMMAERERRNARTKG